MSFSNFDHLCFDIRRDLKKKITPEGFDTRGEVDREIFKQIQKAVLIFWGKRKLEVKDEKLLDYSEKDIEDLYYDPEKELRK